MSKVFVASHRAIAYCRPSIFGLFIKGKGFATGGAFTAAIAVLVSFGMVAVNAGGHCFSLTDFD
jgi:hypothetical protein